MNNSEIIEKLKRLDLSTYPYGEVRNLVGQFQPKFLRITLPEGCLIERIRPDVDVYERKEVTYRPACKNKKPQRATLPYKTAFYGTLCHIEEPTVNMRYVALLEASKLLRQGPMASGKEPYTLSRWVVTKPMRLVVIVDNATFNSVNNNQMLMMAKQEWEKAKTFLDDPLHFDRYSEFVTSQFAKVVEADYEYIVPATIADYLMCTSKCDGVMYPPVQARGEFCMNVALRQDVADDNLTLTDVREMEYEQANGKGHLKFTKDAIPTDVDAHGMKRWTYKTKKI